MSRPGPEDAVVCSYKPGLPAENETGFAGVDDQTKIANEMDAYCQGSRPYDTDPRWRCPWNIANVRLGSTTSVLAELERLSLVINNIDERGDATKALIQLQQKARVIETMCSQIRPSSDASFSGISTSVDTESSSHLDQSSTVTLDTGDQSYDELLPPLIKSDRHSLIIGNNWVLHNNSSSGLTNGHSLIVDPPETNGEIQNGYDTHPTNNLEQRTNMIVNGITSCSSGNLSAVFECKCLRSKEVTCKNIHNSNMNAFVNGHEKCPETTAFVNSNQVTANMFLGFAPTRINELPPLPPPPPPILGKLDFMFWDDSKVPAEQDSQADDGDSDDDNLWAAAEEDFQEDMENQRPRKRMRVERSADYYKSLQRSSYP
ncbi:uncharacterized protein LOC119739084 [Patiria miniata]|uniref:Uncharacterized protein n=1 Tax=Patiria miniata TaxID=46514 RepID=A0A914B2X1_PATMI|nr:uncharacterized protein LOC119739084 [Patiria miniata]